MLGKPNKQEIVVSQVDLEAALKHLNSLPYTVTKEMPTSWGINQVKEWLFEDLPKKYKMGDSFDFGTGLWGHIVPLGYEFASYPAGETRHQLVISIRSVSTDLNQMIVLDG